MVKTSIPSGASPKVKIPRVRLQKRGDVYHYSFYIEKKRYRGSTDKKDPKEAMTIAERELSSIMRKTLGAAFDPESVPASIVFDTHIERLEKVNRSKETLDNYRRYAQRFQAFFHDSKLTHLTRFDIENWRNWLLEQKQNKEVWQHKTLSKKLVKEHLTWLSSIYKEYDLPNPCKRVEFPHKTETEEQEDLRYYTADDLQKLLDVAIANKEHKKGRFSSQFFWWFILISHTGIRLGEAKKLRFKDVIISETSAYFTSDKTKKRRKLNFLSLGEYELSSYYDEKGNEEEVTIRTTINPWFALTCLMNIAENEYKRKGKKIVPESYIYVRYKDWFYSKLREVCEEAKVNPLGVHALRHYSDTLFTPSS